MGSAPAAVGRAAFTSSLRSSSRQRGFDQNTLGLAHPVQGSPRLLREFRIRRCCAAPSSTSRAAFVPMRSSTSAARTCRSCSGSVTGPSSSVRSCCTARATSGDGLPSCALRRAGPAGSPIRRNSFSALSRTGKFAAVEVGNQSLDLFRRRHFGRLQPRLQQRHRGVRRLDQRGSWPWRPCRGRRRPARPSGRRLPPRRGSHRRARPAPTCRSGAARPTPGAVPSALHETRYLPSGENANPVTPPAWPDSVWNSHAADRLCRSRTATPLCRPSMRQPAAVRGETPAPQSCDPPEESRRRMSSPRSVEKTVT